MSIFPASPARRDRLIGERRRRTFEVHTGEPVEPDLLDDRLDDRLRVAQAKNASMDPQPPGQNGEVEHQGGVTEGKLGQVNDHVGARVDGPRKSAAPVPLRGPILVSSTAQYRAGVIELDDSGNLHNPAAGGNPSPWLSGGAPALS